MNCNGTVGKRLILGVGNEILMDDGIGPGLVSDLRKQFGDSSSACFENISLGGMEILDYIRDYDEVVIIDAIKTGEGSKPGEVYLLGPDSFRETSHISNIHDVSFVTALRLAEKLDYSLPDYIIIIGVEVVEDMIFGSEYSPQIAEVYPEVYSEIRSFLQGFILGEVSLRTLVVTS